MHVVLCHDAHIPPSKYGGTERVIYWLARALTELGHRTSVIAKPGSHIPGSQILELKNGQSWEQLIPPDTDVLHFWATPKPVPALPFIVTIEGNGQKNESFYPNTVFISRKHAENHDAQAFVYNGIDLNEYECHKKRERRLVFLAKASLRVKNLKGAIAIARAAHMPLDVLGSRDLPFGVHKYLPRWRGIRYHGMVGDNEKRALLSNALALLYPVRWHEPFGIALIEALASGCAVLGTPYGALPEIITPDVGVLGTTVDFFTKTLQDPWRFNPNKCRSKALEHFSHIEMARQYIQYYNKVLSGSFLSENPSKVPRTISERAGLSAKALLPWQD